MFVVKLFLKLLGGGLGASVPPPDSGDMERSEVSEGFGLCHVSSTEPSLRSFSGDCESSGFDLSHSENL